MKLLSRYYNRYKCTFTLYTLQFILKTTRLNIYHKEIVFKIIFNGKLIV